MAVLEQAQQAAIRGIKTTVVDRFYGTASAAPLSVFPRLVNGAQPHLSKLKRDNAAAGFAINRKIEDILSQVKADKGFPRTLNLQQQGIFALGYYHQRAYDAAQSREASERRRSAREQENNGGSGEEDPEC
jgi:CRISPR-associated protein Csd1